MVKSHTFVHPSLIHMLAGNMEIYFGSLKVEEFNELGSLGAIEEVTEVGGEVEGGIGGEGGVPRKHLTTDEEDFLSF